MANKKVTTTEEITEENSQSTTQPATPTYLTPEDAKKMFQEQMSGFGTFTQEEKQGLVQFMDATGKIFDIIESDPNLKETIRQRASGQTTQTVPTQQSQQGQGQNSQAQVPNQQIQEFGQQVGSVVRSRRAEIIQNFERKYGISSLPEAEQNDTRKRVANKLLQWGHRLDQVPVDALDGLMEDAFLAANPDKLQDQGYVSGILAARQGDAGSMPAMSSGGVSNQEQQGNKPTAAQLDYAQKLGVSEDEIKSTLKEHSN